MVLFLKDCIAHVDWEALFHGCLLLMANIYTMETYSEWWMWVTGDLKHIGRKSWSVYVWIRCPREQSGVRWCLSLRWKMKSWTMHAWTVRNLQNQKKAREVKPALPFPHKAPIECSRKKAFPATLWPSPGDAEFHIWVLDFKKVNCDKVWTFLIFLFVHCLPSIPSIHFLLSFLHFFI